MRWPNRHPMWLTVGHARAQSALARGSAADRLTSFTRVNIWTRDCDDPLKLRRVCAADEDERQAVVWVSRLKQTQGRSPPTSGLPRGRLRSRSL
jgi:hypothetical protein